MGRKQDTAEAVSAKLAGAVSMVAEAVEPVLLAARDAGVDPRTLGRDALWGCVTMRGLGAALGVSAMTVYPWLDRQGDGLRDRLRALGASVHPTLDGKGLVLELARAVVLGRWAAAAAAASSPPTALPAPSRPRRARKGRKPA